MGQEEVGGCPVEPQAWALAGHQTVGATVVGTERPAYDAPPPRQPASGGTTRGSKPLLWVSRPQLEVAPGAPSAPVQALLSGYGLGPAANLWPGHPAVRVGVANTSAQLAQRQERLRSLESSLDKGRRPSAKAYPPAPGRGQPAWNKGAGAGKPKAKQGAAASSASGKGPKAARVASRAVGVQVSLSPQAPSEGQRPVAVQPEAIDTDMTAEKPAVLVEGGKLSGLCEEDKQKVSKLIRQVVDLGGEIRRLEVELTQAYGARETAEDRQAQEAKLHKAVAKENSKLKKKLVHALDMIRSYQARVEVMSELPPPSAWAAGQQHPQPAAPAEPQAPANLQRTPTQGVGSLPASARPPPAGQPPVAASGAATPSTVSVITIRPDETVRIASAPAGSQQRMEASPSGQYSPGAQPGGADELAEAVRRLDAMVNAPDEYYGVPVGFRVEDTSGDYSLLGPPRPRVLKYDPNLGENGAFYFVDVDELSKSQGGSPVKQPQQQLTSISATAAPGEMLSLLDSVQRGSSGRGAHSDSPGLEPTSQPPLPGITPEGHKHIPTDKPANTPAPSNGQPGGSGEDSGPTQGLGAGYASENHHSSSAGGTGASLLPRPYVGTSSWSGPGHPVSAATVPDMEPRPPLMHPASPAQQDGGAAAGALPPVAPPQLGTKRPLSPSPATSTLEDSSAAVPNLDIGHPDDQSRAILDEETVEVEALQTSGSGPAHSLSSAGQPPEDMTTTEVLSGATASTGLAEAVPNPVSSFYSARFGPEPSPGSSLSSLPLAPDVGLLSSTANLLLNTPGGGGPRLPKETSMTPQRSEHGSQTNPHAVDADRAADSEPSPDVSLVVTSPSMRGVGKGQTLRPRSAARQSPVAAGTEAAGRPATLRYVTDLSGFDDSLMDLVSEVESMELGSPSRISTGTLDLNIPPHAYQRAPVTPRAAPGSGAPAAPPATAALPTSSAWPHSPRTLPLSAQATRLMPYRTPGAPAVGGTRAGSEGGWMRRGLFEENDIISTIMDAEELARSLYSEAESTSNPQ